MKKNFDYKQKTLINAWISQAEVTSNDYLKFMSNWIAFNAICYNLFSERAVRERADIKDISKLRKIKDSVERNYEIQAESTSLIFKDEKIDINIKTSERLSFSIKEKYTEDMIYHQFANSYFNKINVDEEVFQCLKESLKKIGDDRFYVINMARIKAYNKYKKEKDINTMADIGILILCETNNLKTIKNVLYQIRCNIFHGAKTPGHGSDDQIVKAANPILEQLIKYLVNEQGIK